MLFGPHDLGSATNYTAALDELNVLRAQVPAGQNVVVAFLSDGIPNETVAGQVFTNVLNALPTTGLTIDTFAVGVGQCGTAAPSQFGSLEQIAVHFGKHCQVLTDASDAVDLVPGVVASKLSSVSVSVDGGARDAGGTTSPAVPANGPATVLWSDRDPVPTLAAGTAPDLRDRGRQRRRRQRHVDRLRRRHGQGAADGHRR